MSAVFVAFDHFDQEWNLDHQLNQVLPADPGVAHAFASLLNRLRRPSVEFYGGLGPKGLCGARVLVSSG